NLPAVAEIAESAPSATATATATADKRPAPSDRALKLQRQKVARLLAENKLDEEQIEIDLNDHDLGRDDMSGGLEFMQGMSPEEMSESFSDFLDGYRSLQSGIKERKRMRRVSVREARRILTDEEAHKLMDVESILENAVKRTEQTGVVFIDEIDKITGNAIDTGPDVSDEGVQRELLPIDEGPQENTRY